MVSLSPSTDAPSPCSGTQKNKIALKRADQAFQVLNNSRVYVKESQGS